MNLTGKDDSLDKKGLGYVVNAPCSEAFIKHIQSLQESFQKAFGNAVYCPGQDVLHFTLCDFLTTVFDYSEAEKRQFEEFKETYEKAISDILSEQKSFDIDVDTIEYFPSCIIVKAKDNGEFKRIRDEFISKVKLIGKTKVPPPIIHSTIVAFRESVDRDRVKEFINKMNLPFTEHISKFRLVKETQNRHQDFEVLKTYTLKD